MAYCVNDEKGRSATGTEVRSRAAPSVSGSRSCRKRLPVRRQANLVSGSAFVVAHHHAVADRMALARQHETVADFVFFERVVLLHLDFAFQHLRTASAADAALARVRQREAGSQTDVKHAHPLIRETKLAPFSVEYDFEVGSRRVLGDLDWRHTCLRQRRAEAF